RRHVPGRHRPAAQLLRDVLAPERLGRLSLRRRWRVDIVSIGAYRAVTTPVPGVTANGSSSGVRNRQTSIGGVEACSIRHAGSPDGLASSSPPVFSRSASWPRRAAATTPVPARPRPVGGRPPQQEAGPPRLAAPLPPPRRRPAPPPRRRPSPRP